MRGILVGMLCLLGCSIGSSGCMSKAEKEKQENAKVFLAGAKVFLVKAKETVAAWPENPELFQTRFFELRPLLEQLPDMTNDPPLHELAVQLDNVRISCASAFAFLSYSKSVNENIDQYKKEISNAERRNAEPNKEVDDTEPLRKLYDFEPRSTFDDAKSARKMLAHFSEDLERTLTEANTDIRRAKSLIAEIDEWFAGR